MKKLIALTSAFIASVLLYVAVFAVVDRPLTLGDITAAMRMKSDYALALPHPKLLVWAGSNGRYSHRCAPLTAGTGLPCANLSVAVGIGIDIQLLAFEPLLQRGDLMYLPLEYSQYRVERAEMEGGAENTVLVHQRRDLLWTLPPERIARAWASFDLPFLVHGLIESALARSGFQRRNGLQTLTPQGDESGHTRDLARAYVAFLQSVRFDTAPIPVRSRALEVLEAFLQRAAQRGVLVVGGLPTTPQGVALDLAGIERLRAMYLRHGHRFLVLENRSQYPLSCFYDTLYHLTEECQIQHSTLLGLALRDEIRRDPRQAP